MQTLLLNNPCVFLVPHGQGLHVLFCWTSTAAAAWSLGYLYSVVGNQLAVVPLLLRPIRQSSLLCLVVSVYVEGLFRLVRFLVWRFSVHSMDLDEADSACVGQSRCFTLRLAFWAARNTVLSSTAAFFAWLQSIGCLQCRRVAAQAAVKFICGSLVPCLLCY